jgi:uncharacterized protein (TIGR02099 family)
LYAILRFVANFTWVAALSFVILLAAYVVLGRQFFPAVSLYQSEIEALVKNETGITIDIGEIQGRWDGLNPVVELRSIEIIGQSAKDGDRTTIDALSIELAIIESVTSGQIKIDDLRIGGVQVAAVQDETGQWSVFGLTDLTASGVSDPDRESISWAHLLSTYLVQPYLEVSDIGIRLEDQAGEHFLWRIPNAQLLYSNNEISARGEIIAPQTNELFAKFAVEGSGRFASSDFDGTLFLEWQTGHFLSQFLHAYHWQGLEIARLDASGRAWVRFEKGELNSVFSTMKVPELQLRTTAQSIVPIQDASLNVRWQIGAEATRLSITDLDFMWRGMQWGSADYVLHKTAGSSWLRGSRLNLDVLTPLILSTGLLDDDARQNLAGYSPSGILQNVDFLLTTAKSGVETDVSEKDGSEKDGSEKDGSEVAPASVFSFKANLLEVGVLAYDGAPRGLGVNGFIHADNNGGYVQFASDTFEMGFPNLFLDSWSFKYAEGVVKWDVSGPITEIFSEGLVLDYSEGGRVLGDFRFSVPETTYDRYLTLSIAPFGLPASATTRFLPWHVVDKGLYDWLDHAVISGIVTQGLYVGHGPVGDGDPEGLFESAMYFDVIDGEVNFDDAWPHVKNFNGRIAVDPNLLQVSVNKGKLGPLDVNGAVIQKNLFSRDAADLPESHPIEIDLRRKFSGADVAWAMAELPIKEFTGEVARSVQINGRLGLSLDLDLYLTKDIPNKEKVVITFPGVDLKIPEAHLDFKAVAGELVYTTAAGISGNLHMKVFDRPGTLVARTIKENDQISTQLLLNGSADLTSVFNWLDLTEPFGVTGDLNYTASLDVSMTQQDTVAALDIKSDLVGIASEWPSLLGKAAATDMPLHYRKMLHNSKDTEGGLCFKPGIVVGDCFRLGDWLQGWRLPGESDDAVTLALNNPDAMPGTEPGVWLRGELQSFDLQPWSVFFKRMKDQSADGSQIESQASNPVANKAVSPIVSKADKQADNKSGKNKGKKAAGVITGANLNIGSIKLLSQTFTNTQVAFEASDSGHHLTLNGSDVVGNIWFPQDPLAGIEVDLQRLSLKSPTPTEKLMADLPLTDATLTDATLTDATLPPATIPQPPPPDVVDLDDWRDFRLSVKALSIDNMYFDSLLLNVDVNKDAHSVTVYPLKLVMDDDVADGRLSWQQDALAPSVSRTIISGQIAATQTAERLEKLGYASPLNSKQGYVEYSLTWPDGPMDYSLQSLSGTISLNLAEGNINLSTSSANVLRLFGILNLDALSRRLRLDFSDLTDRGISFDTLSATGSVRDGLLTFEEPLLIQGPSNIFRFTGQTSLVDETLDLSMVVVLPLTQNLPLAALFVGAPVVGGGLWVVDKLLGDPLSKITSATYNVKGSWDAPEINLRSIFDNTAGARGADNSVIAPIFPVGNW